VESFARRPLDLAARYGGEEFAVILYDLARPDVQIMSEKLREIVQNLCIESPASAAAEITVSVGIGIAVPTNGRTPQGAVQLADEALYAAKNAGRNCIVIKGVEAYLRLVTGAFKSPQYIRK
jgi:diguanylate cyclase (GGDEF)-like protein